MIRKIKKTSKLTTPSMVKGSVATASTMSTLSSGSQDTKPIFSSVFEVFGKVQGVYFRKHTQSKAKQLGVHGWCMNTDEGTVKGVIEGNLEKLAEMKSWLQHKGSPRSIITKATFGGNEPLPIHNFRTFSIRR